MILNYIHNVLKLVQSTHTVQHEIKYNPFEHFHCMLHPSIGIATMIL